MRSARTHKGVTLVCSTLCVPPRFVSILVFSGPAFAWLWTVFKLGNGIDHTALASSQGGYFPGVATAPVLLALSTCLAVHSRQRARDGVESLRC